MRPVSKAEYELHYWRESGIQRGIGVYLRYFEMFGLVADDFADLDVADVGCGPLGGILSILPAYGLRIGVDPLLVDYAAGGMLSALPWIGWYGCRAAELPDALYRRFDAVFSVNALDHDIRPGKASFAAGYERLRALVKPGGRLFVYVHLRTAGQLNQGHDFRLEEREVLAPLRSWSVKNWRPGLKLDGDYADMMVVARKP